MMNFVTSVFKRYMNKNETKTEIEKHEEDKAQSKNEPVRSEGLDESTSFSSLGSLTEKQKPEPNEYFQDAQENTAISNVSSEMDRDNRANLFISDAEGKVRGQVPDILCDTSSNETMLHRYDVYNNTTDGRENLSMVLPSAGLDLLNKSSLVDSLHGSDLSPQKIINSTDDAINNKNLATRYEDSNSNKNISSLNRTDQKSGPTTKNKSSENVSIGNKLVSLSDILGNNSVPATEEHFESNLHTMTNIDETNNLISSECAAKPGSALETLIHSVNNTFVMKTSENDAFCDDASHTNREMNTDLGQIEDTVSAIDEKNNAVNSELRSVTNLIGISFNNPAKTVESKSDQQDFETEKIGNDLFDENTDTFEKDEIGEVMVGEIDLVEKSENHEKKVINAVPKFETSDTVIVSKGNNSTKELNALDTASDLMDIVQSKPDNIIGRVADELKNQKQSLEEFCETELQNAKIQNLEKTNGSIAKTDINENIKNCKELDADDRSEVQVPSNVEINDQNPNEYKVSQSRLENIPIETDDHETISYITDNSEEIDKNLTEEIKSIQNTSGSKHLEIIDNNFKTEQTESGKTSTTSSKSDKLKGENLEIQTNQNNEVKVSGVLNLEPITSKISESSMPKKEDFNEDTTVLNIIENQNAKKFANCETATNQNDKTQISDDILYTQDSANTNLPTILEESMTSTSSTSETAENSNNSNQNTNLPKGIINQKCDKHMFAQDLTNVNFKTELDESVIDNSSDLEKIEVATEDNTFSELPSKKDPLEKYEPELHEELVSTRRKSLEEPEIVSSTNTEQLEKIDRNSKESIITNHESLTVTTTLKPINSLEVCHLKSDNIDTENIQSPTQSINKIMDKRHDMDESKTIEEHNNGNSISDSTMSKEECDKLCRIYERQDTKEFENLERQFEEQNPDVNQLQRADILEKLILESDKSQQSKNDNDNHNRPIAQRIEDPETTPSECIDKNITKKVDNIEEIQRADRENLLHRQDTQEFEHFEKQYKEEECHQLRNDNILEELVAESTDRYQAEDNTAKTNSKHDEEQISLKTEVTFETNTKDEDFSDQKTFTDTVVKQVLKNGNEFASSQTEINLTYLDCNITIREDNTDQHRSPKHNDRHVKDEHKKQNQKVEELSNNLRDKAEISSNKESEETNKSSQNGSQALTQELHNQLLTNENQTRNEESIDKSITKKVDNMEEIQRADRENLLHRQDTQEFEHFEKQYKEEECHQLRNDNILEELVAESKDRYQAEDNKAKTNSKHDEGQVSPKTEITVESNTKDEDFTGQTTFTDSVVRQVACLDCNITIHEDNNQHRSPKHNDGQVKNENQKEIIPPTKISDELNNNLKDKAEISINKENEETNRSSQNGTQAQTQELHNQPLTNENQNRNEEIMSKVDLLQQELDSIKKRNKRKGKPTPEFEEKRESNINVISEYKNLLDEYEKQIVQQDNDLEEMKIKCEENVRRFTTTEMAFSDVFEKYEKAKYAITVYGKNEDILLENIQNAEEQLSQIETKCFSMKQQAVEQINRAHEQVEREKAKCKQEITKLQVQVKMLEIKAASLETAFKQKSDECLALAAFCEDITGRNTTRA